MTDNCPTCTPPQAPDYPVVCPKCFQEYGPTSTVTSHRIGSLFCANRQLVQAKSGPFNLLTKRVTAWTIRVLGTKLLASRRERTMRLVEEALELGQAEKLDVADAHKLVDYVYGRPVGEVSQEAGGIMVCMLAWACAAGIDLEKVMSKEVDRLETIDAEKVRTKQHMKVARGIGLAPDV